MGAARRLALMALMSWAVVVAIAAAAHAQERRVALVIGNSRYQNVPELSNTINDAQLIAATLQRLGFVLVGGKAQTDLDLAAMKKVLLDFRTQAASADVALFYYAGHGLQMTGVNWLVPIDANPTSAADADFQLLDADTVLKQMDASGARLKLMILDACRNNPLGGRGLRDVGAGLAEMHAPHGTLISYATQPGAVASDGPAGANGPFAAALAQSMTVAGTNVFDMLNNVALKVEKATGDAQQPWFASSPLDGQFYFAGPAPSAPTAAAAQSTAVPAASDHSGADIEMLFWQSIKDSSNTADFQAYLNQYPKGAFAGLARNRIAALTPKPASAPAPAPAPSSAAKPSQVATAAAPPPAPVSKPAPALQSAPEPQPPAQRSLVVADANYANEKTNFGVPPLNILQANVGSPTPTALNGGRVVSTAALATALKANWTAILLDVWQEQTHTTLPGAHRFPLAGAYGNFDDAEQQRLVNQLAVLTNHNVNVPLVFCAGSECWESYNAALRALHIGFKEVYWYRGGVAAWKAAGLPLFP